MKENKNEVRLYVLYNVNVDKEGAPFAMCDKHIASYSVPNCVVRKIADKAVGDCELCNEPILI